MDSIPTFCTFIFSTGHKVAGPRVVVVIYAFTLPSVVASISASSSRGWCMGCWVVASCASTLPPHRPGSEHVECLNGLTSTWWTCSWFWTLMNAPTAPSCTTHDTTNKHNSLHNSRTQHKIPHYIHTTLAHHISEQCTTYHTTPNQWSSSRGLVRWGLGPRHLAPTPSTQKGSDVTPCRGHT